MKPIVKSPNPVLSAPAKTVQSFDKRFAKLVADMKSTLKTTVNPKGVGLAAPQNVGSISLRSGARPE